MIALYERVSTQEQLNGYSIDEQKNKLEQYCGVMNWNACEHYTDGGFSGATTDRPALKRMIKDIERKKIDKVLVYKLDRLSRSQLDTLYLIDKVFLPNGTDFVSITENFDTSSPFGRAMLGILAVFAQLEREQIKERMSMGRQARAKEGKFHGSATVPIGYDYVNGELIVNEFEKSQINKAYELYANGSGIQSICDYLNANGMTHKHGKWLNLTLRNILAKKTYLGYTYFNGQWYKGTHAPIVSEELFRKVESVKNKKHQDYLSYGRRDGMATSFLGGFLVCKHCGAKYIKCSNYSRYKDNVKRLPIYKCASRAKKDKASIKDPNCKNKVWKMNELDELIFDEIRNLKIEPQELHVSQQETQNFADEIDKIDNQIKRLMDLYSVGDMPLDIIQQKVSELNSQRNKLESYEPPESISMELISDSLLTFDDILKGGDLAEIRSILGVLIDYIELDNDDIVIHWNFTV